MPLRLRQKIQKVLRQSNLDENLTQLWYSPAFNYPHFVQASAPTRFLELLNRMNLL
jgi:hypothetical protein